MKLNLGWLQDTKLCKNKHEIKVRMVTGSTRNYVKINKKFKLGWLQDMKLCKNKHEIQGRMVTGNKTV